MMETAVAEPYGVVLRLFICLMAAHFLGDFVLQTDYDASNKRKFLVLVKHAGIVAVLTYVVCGVWSRWEIPAVVFLTHALADYLKAKFAKKPVRSFLIDQAAHLAIMGGIAILIPRTGPAASYWDCLLGVTYFRILVLVTGTIVTVSVGAILIGMAVEPLQRKLEPKSSKVEDKSEQPLASRLGFEHGGRLIGQLERALILLFVLVGEPAAIGFLIAAKSVLRFGEVKEPRNRMEAEYIIIGTLASFLFGLLVAYPTRFLLSLL